MNIIIFSHMYPRKSHPYSGTFVEEQVQALKHLTAGNISVISPVPWAPRLLWFRGKWREYGRTEVKSVRNGVTVYYPRYIAIPGKRFSFLSGIFMYLSARNLARELLKANVGQTIVHAHSILPAGLAALLLKKDLGIRIACTAHGSDINSYPTESKLFRALTKQVLQKADLIVAVSGELKEKIQRISSRADISVVTNGINPEKITAYEGNSGRQFPEDDVTTILFVGTVRVEKGVRELMRAFTLLKDHYERLKLVMVGNNLMPKWISSFIKDNRLQASVELTGPVEHAAMREYYSRASIFALPSYGEGMPTVMFEAMANRLPIVICRVGGVSEVIKDGVNGLLIEPGSVQDLYEKLKVLIENKEMRNMLSSSAFADATLKYTWDHNAKKMLNVYEGMLYKDSSSGEQTASHEKLPELKEMRYHSEPDLDKRQARKSYNGS